MADRVYPSSKPVGANGTTVAAKTPTFPPTKAQIYGASTRPLYQPQPTRHRRRRRSCCCSFCLWFTLVIIVLIILAAVAGAIVYVLYRPQRPSFTVSSLKISTFNLTAASRLTTKINLNISAKNPNKKLVYIYNPVSVSLTTADDIDVGDGSLPSFVHPTKNTTLLKVAITGTSQELDDAAASKLKTDLKSKKGVALKLKLNTKVKVKMGALKTPKVGVRVSCEGIRATVPTGKTATTASTSNAKCKVDLRIKIWKWTF
ncbi:hypothetical protein SLA2020_290450 [Shorea laevis]